MPLCYGNTQRDTFGRVDLEGKLPLTVCLIHVKITFHLANKPLKISKIITHIAFSVITGHRGILGVKTAMR